MMGITIHYTFHFKGNADSLHMMLEKAVAKFKNLGDLEISAMMDTGVIKFKGEWLSIEEEEAIAQKLALQGGISAIQAGEFFYVQRETMQQFHLIGFSALFAGECAGCAPFHVGFVNNFQQKEETWRLFGFTKTEWADDFFKAHVKVTEMIKIMRDLGCKVFVDDEAGYWGNEDLERLKNYRVYAKKTMESFVKKINEGGFNVFPLFKKKDKRE